MVNGPAAAITTLRLAVADFPEESVTSAVKLKLPTIVGVPERRPLVAKVNPAGSEPPDAVQAYPVPVPPVAANVAEYDTVTTPPAKDDVVTTNGPEVEEPGEPPPQAW